MPFTFSPVVYQLTPVRQDATALFYVITDPRLYVHWVLVGLGSISPIDLFTNANGVAMVKYVGTGVPSGSVIEIHATVHQ